MGIDRSTLSSVRPSPSSAFLDAMSQVVSAVTVVTCWVDGRPWGMTVTAFASVSAAPPTVLVSLSTTSETARAIAAEGRFGISILGRRQLAVARHCSTSGRPKFIDEFVDTPRSDGGEPIVAGALAHLDCDLVDRLEVADHTIFVASVRASRAAPSRGDAALVYQRRAYRALASPEHAGPSTKRRPPCPSS